MTEDKAKLNEAFRIFRKQGLFARQDFACCMTCGFYEAEQAVKHGGDKQKGIVFYHHQDTQAMRKGGGVHLRYCAIVPEGTSDKAHSEATKKIGEDIVAVLRGIGLETQWDGDPNKTVYVEVKYGA